MFLKLQVYVKGSVEATKLYQRAFDAKVGHSTKNADGTYLHVELDIDQYKLVITEAEDVLPISNSMQFQL